MKTLFLRIVQIAFLFFSFTAYSQSDPKNLTNLTLEELLNIKITVASKIGEKISKAPSSVIVFTNKDIDRMGIHTIEEVLNFVPGFHVSRDIEQGRAFRISSRGRSTALSESVLFLVDGIRLNDLYTGGISVLNRHLPVGNIKQIEIIRGPGSALYGSNAFLGVVNIVTSSHQNDASFRVGNLNSKTIELNFSTDQSSASVSAYLKYFSDDGDLYKNISDQYGRIKDSTDPRSGIDAHIKIKIAKSEIILRHMERNFKGFMTFGTLSEFQNNESTKQSSIQFQTSTKFSKDVRSKYTLSYTTDRWEAVALGIPANTEIAPGFTIQENVIVGPFLRSENIKASSDFTYIISKNANILWGISYEQSSTLEVANLFSHNPVTLEFEGPVTKHTSDSTNFNIIETRHILGVYGQAKLQIIRDLSLTLGARFDNYSDFGSTINPRSALVYQTPINSNFKIMYGSAFRAPNFLELYDKNNPVDFGNKNLNPEKVKTIEFAYIQRLSGMEITSTYFRNSIKNPIDFGEVVSHPLNPLGAPSFKNKESEWHSSGIEINSFFKLFNKLSLYTSFTRLFEKDHHVGSTFFSYSINYKYKSFGINLNSYYRSAIPNIESYQLTNIHLKFRFNESINLTINSKNIFDKNYYSFTQYPIKNGVPNRRRNIQLGLNVKL